MVGGGVMLPETPLLRRAQISEDCVQELDKFLVTGAQEFCQVSLSFQPQRLTGWWGEKRVPSPEAGCRSGRKPAGLGFAGAGDVTICFSSAGRQGEKAVILCSVMAGEWVFVCVCVCVENEVGEGRARY